MDKVVWIGDMRTVISRTKAEKKPILLDFFNPKRIGCQQTMRLRKMD